MQSENQRVGTASIYAVVDQTYVNNKITTPAGRRGAPRSPTLQRVDGVWKIADVTVLEGATPGQRREPLGLGGVHGARVSSARPAPGARAPAGRRGGLP